MLLLFFALFFWSGGMWDLHSPTREEPVPFALEDLNVCVQKAGRQIKMILGAIIVCVCCLMCVLPFYSEKHNFSKWNQIIKYSSWRKPFIKKSIIFASFMLKSHFKRNLLFDVTCLSFSKFQFLIITPKGMSLTSENLIVPLVKIRQIYFVKSLPANFSRKNKSYDIGLFYF